MARPKKVSTQVPVAKTVASESPIQKTVAAATEAVLAATAAFSPEEIQLILDLRSKAGQPKGIDPVSNVGNTETKLSVNDLAEAMGKALVAIKPFEKKTIITRKKMNPWMPKDGSPKIMKFKRPMYHHGIPIEPKYTYNADCLLLDKLKPGRYCGGYITVTKRKDNGLDIDYQMRTSAQRLKLVNTFGITSFNSLIQRLLDERADPKKYAQPGDDMDDD